MDSSQLLIREYLQSHNVLCLATTLDNHPWVSPVFYANDDTGLIFLSAPHTRHCKNISVNPRVSASIQQEYSDWDRIKGIQLEGEVTLVTAQHRAQVIDRYAKKFPVTGDQAPPEIAKAIDKIQWFYLIVRKMFFIDNSKGLGNREEVDLSNLFPESAEGIIRE